MSVVLLEQTRPSPAWWLALEVALTRPPGVPERRADEDPWTPGPAERLERLLARGILEAAGFHLHRADRFSP